MEIKVNLNDVNRRLIERVCEVIDQETGIDEEGFIEVDTIMDILDSFETQYMRLEEEKDRYKYRESEREHLLSESFNRGFHPDDYA